MKIALEPQHVAVIGGGLAGSLFALELAQRGHRVDVYERRSDPRLRRGEEGRSINLGLSKRGITALGEIGLLDDVLAVAVSMEGRVIHAPDGSQRFQPYGKNRQEVLHSIDRNELNDMLLDRAEAPRLPARKNVFRDRQVRAQIHFLVKRAHACRLGFLRRREGHDFACETDRAGVGREDACQHIDQRRFAGAVLSHQRMDFAGEKPEIDALQRLHARECLRDAGCFENRLVRVAVVGGRSGGGPCRARGRRFGFGSGMRHRPRSSGGAWVAGACVPWCLCAVVAS